MFTFLPVNTLPISSFLMDPMSGTPLFVHINYIASRSVKTGFSRTITSGLTNTRKASSRLGTIFLHLSRSQTRIFDNAYSIWGVFFLRSFRYR